MESAMPSKDRARSPIWSRDLDWTRTEKSPRAAASVARVSRLTLRAIEPTRTNAIVSATAYTKRTIAADHEESDAEGAADLVHALREELADDDLRRGDRREDRDVLPSLAFSATALRAVSR